MVWTNSKAKRIVKVSTFEGIWSKSCRYGGDSRKKKIEDSKLLVSIRVRNNQGTYLSKVNGPEKELGQSAIFSSARRGMWLNSVGIIR